MQRLISSSFLLGICAAFFPFYKPYGFYLNGRWELDVLFLIVTILYVFLFRVREKSLVFLVIISIFLMSSNHDARVLFQTALFSMGVLFCACVESDDRIDTFYELVGWSSVLGSLWVISEYFGFSPFRLFLDPTKTVATRTILGPLANHTLSGAWIAVASQGLFKRRWWVLPITCFSLWVLGSSMAWGAFLVGIWWQLPRFKVLVAMAGGVCILVLGHLHPEILDGQNRLAAWKIVFEHPFGMGWGHLSALLPKWSYGRLGVEYFVEAHNEYIELLYALKWWSLVVVYWVLKGFMKADRVGRAIILVVLANSCANFTLHLSVISFIWLVVIGYYLNKVDERFDYCTIGLKYIWRKSYEIFVIVSSFRVRAKRISAVESVSARG